MKGPDRGIRVAVRHQLVDPELHLRSCLLREGQGEDFRRLRPSGGDEPRDPPGDDLRLARAGSGDDEEWPVAMGDGTQLLRVQAPKKRVQASRRIPAEWLRGRVCKAIPDRHLFEWDRFAPGAQTGHVISRG
jgi:hypothetical protein